MQNSESGSALLSLIVASGIVLALMTMAMKVRLKSQVVNAVLYAKESADYQQENFTDSLAKFVAQYIERICSGQNPVGLSFPLKGSSAIVSASIQPIADVTTTESLAQRCRRPRYAADGSVYFCLRLDQNPEQPASSFLGARDTFAEIAVRPVDAWQRPVSCQSYRNMPKAEAGLQIFYRFYWIPEGRIKNLHQRSGLYYARQ